MKRWQRPMVAAMALGLFVTGCGQGSDGDGDTETPTTENGNEQPDGEATGNDQQPDGEASENGGQADASTSGIPVPVDIEINEVARHPGGTAMHVSGITFGPNEIRVTAEFINGATGDVAFRLTGGNRLRIIDNLGNEYNYVPPAELRDRNSFNIAQGASVGGEFVFAGPVSSEASSMVITANSMQSNPQASDMQTAFEGENQPVIVFDGIDLSW